LHNFCSSLVYHQNDNLLLHENNPKQQLLFVGQTFENDENRNPVRISFRGKALVSGSAILEGETLTSTLADGSCVSTKLSPLTLSVWNANLDSQGYLFRPVVGYIHSIILKSQETEDEAKKRWSIGWNGKGKLIVAHNVDNKQNPNFSLLDS